MSEFWQSVCIAFIWTWAIVTLIRAFIRATMKAKQTKENEDE
jgi:hypothetical protein